jgi:hypothetical protein
MNRIQAIQALIKELARDQSIDPFERHKLLADLSMIVEEHLLELESEYDIDPEYGYDVDDDDDDDFEFVDSVDDTDILDDDDDMDDDWDDVDHRFDHDW